MNLITKARKAAKKYGGVSGASVALGIPRSTLRDWLAKTTPKEAKNPPKIPPIFGQWMQSLHHDSAHYITNGQAACSAAVTAGDRWFPHDGCVRKCTRCMPHANRGGVK
jgi:hypothetical protein